MNKAIKKIACVILALSIVFTFSSVVLLRKRVAQNPKQPAPIRGMQVIRNTLKVQA